MSKIQRDRGTHELHKDALIVVVMKKIGKIAYPIQVIPANQRHHQN